MIISQNEEQEFPAIVNTENPGFAEGWSGANAEPLFYQYRYDQLNRLKAMQAFNGLSANSWAPVAIDDHKESVAYDPNGNILCYHRKGGK